MVAAFLGWVSGFFQNLFSVLMTFLGNLFGALFNGLITVLKFLFKPILILLALIFYFIYKLGELLVTLFLVLLAIGKLLYQFVMGIYNTLTGLAWTPTATPNHGRWSAHIVSVFDALDPYQLDKVAYIMMFVIWVTTALVAINTLSRSGD